jgi:Domain of unknown function (DUF4124)
MLHKILTALLLSSLAATAAAETVYKWVDSSGQVHYTDLPPRNTDARILGVYEQEGAGFSDEPEPQDDGFEEDGDDDAGSPPQDDEPSSPEPPPSEEAMAAAEADAAKARVEQCKAAQDRYQRYIESQRLYRETPDGKRQYLTDAELTEARARARQTVSDYCG